MAVRIPKITGQLRKYALQLAADPKALVDQTFARLVEHEESYARLPAPLAQDVMQFLEFCAKLWFNSLIHGTRPTVAELEVLAEVGRRRVHQGVPLTALLRASRLGALEVWQACIACPDAGQEDRDELLFSVSAFMLEFFDSVSQAMSSGYLEEQYQRVRWRDSLRYELASVIFQFPDDTSSFQKTAEALGLDPTVPRVALALQLDLSGNVASKWEGEFDRHARTASRKCKIEYEDVVRVFHRGRLIIWVPTIRGETVVMADRRIGKCAAQLLQGSAEIQAVGVGLSGSGPAGWAATVDEACKAVEFGLRNNPTRTVHLYSDIAINESARKNENVLRYLNSLLERLADEPELLTTLQSYFDNQLRRKLTADALGIHPNTLNNRLERVESLLGANLADAGWIAKLHILVKLRR